MQEPGIKFNPEALELPVTEERKAHLSLAVRNILIATNTVQSVEPIIQPARVAIRHELIQTEQDHKKRVANINQNFGKHQEAKEAITREAEALANVYRIHDGLQLHPDLSTSDQITTTQQEVPHIVDNKTFPIFKQPPTQPYSSNQQEYARRVA